MVCVLCGSKTEIINSRAQRRSNQVWRRRRCQVCAAVFTTEEAVRYGAVWTVRDNQGTLQPFSRDKLFLSLYQSCRHRPAALRDASGLTDTIIGKLQAQAKAGVLDAGIIARMAQVALNRFDGAASVAYQAFHA